LQRFRSVSLLLLFVFIVLFLQDHLGFIRHSVEFIGFDDRRRIGQWPKFLVACIKLDLVRSPDE